MKRIYWAFRRLEKRTAHRLIEWLARRYGWHNTILDTNIPNVPFLKCENITVRNGYGQRHEHDFTSSTSR